MGQGLAVLLSHIQHNLCMRSAVSSTRSCTGWRRSFKLERYTACAVHGPADHRVPKLVAEGQAATKSTDPAWNRRALISH